MAIALSKTHAHAKVLLVDDDEQLRAATRIILEREGYHVDEAANADDALAAFHDGIDLVITDHLMPGRLGTELAAEIRRRRHQLPIILITANPPADTSSVCAVMKKPFCPKEFAHAVRNYCRP